MLAFILSVIPMVAGAYSGMAAVIALCIAAVALTIAADRKVRSQAKDQAAEQQPLVADQAPTEPVEEAQPQAEPSYIDTICAMLAKDDSALDHSEATVDTTDDTAQPAQEALQEEATDDELIEMIRRALMRQPEQTVAEAPVAEEEPVTVQEAAEEPAPVLAEEEPVTEEEPAAVPIADEAMEEEDVLPLPAVDIAGGDQAGFYVYSRSFLSKLMKSCDDYKRYYSVIKNELLSYRRVHSRYSWPRESFRYSRALVAAMAVRGKTLCLYLALDPHDEQQFKPNKYHQRDVSDVKLYSDVPFMVRVKSERGLKRALALIAILMQTLGAVKNPRFVATDYTADLPFRTDKKLLEQGLIKLVLTKRNVVLIGDETREQAIQRIQQELLAADVDDVAEDIEQPQDDIATVDDSDNQPLAQDLSVVLASGFFDFDTYSRSFRAKLMQGSATNKDYYSAIKNALLSYRRVHARYSWRRESFRLGRVLKAAMAVRGKTLCLYLALDPNDEQQFNPNIYHQRDVSDRKVNADVPMMVRVKSDLGLKRALALIAILMQQAGAVPDPRFEAVDYVPDFPYATDEELLPQGLVKKIVARRAIDVHDQETPLQAVQRMQQELLAADAALPEEEPEDVEDEHDEADDEPKQAIIAEEKQPAYDNTHILAMVELLQQNDDAKDDSEPVAQAEPQPAEAVVEQVEPTDPYIPDLIRATLSPRQEDEEADVAEESPIAAQEPVVEQVEPIAEEEPVYDNTHILAMDALLQQDDGDTDDSEPVAQAEPQPADAIVEQVEPTDPYIPDLIRGTLLPQQEEAAQQEIDELEDLDIEPVVPEAQPVDKPQDIAEQEQEEQPVQETQPELPAEPAPVTEELIAEEAQPIEEQAHEAAEEVQPVEKPVQQKQPTPKTAEKEPVFGQPVPTALYDELPPMPEKAVEQEPVAEQQPVVPQEKPDTLSPEEEELQRMLAEEEAEQQEAERKAQAKQQQLQQEDERRIPLEQILQDPRFDDYTLFEKKMFAATGAQRYYYSELKNTILSYKKVRNKIANAGESFRQAGHLIARITLNNDQLRLHLCLDPTAYNSRQFGHYSMAKYAAYQEVPLTLDVMDSHSLRNAVQLINEAMGTKYLLYLDKKYQPVDYAAQYTVAPDGTVPPKPQQD